MAMLGPCQDRRQKTPAETGLVGYRRTVMLRRSHPEWGCRRIADMLLRGPASPASPSAVARVLYEARYEPVEEPTRPHREKVPRCDRAPPNQLWQTDLFTLVLRRQNRRVHLVVFLDGGW